MKLGDMTFKDSRDAELQIIPIIEKILKNKDTSDALGVIFSEIPVSPEDASEDEKKEARRKAVKTRVEASKKLTKLLIYTHYEKICEIFAILNGQTPAEIEQWTRKEANEQISDMLNDPDLQSFFMSSEALVQAVSSAI